jgi:hypothetical protein
MAYMFLDRITIYPIKSLDGVDLEEVQVLPNGGLENDRRFALVDAAGRFVNGKRTAAVHRIRARFDLAEMTVRLRDTTGGTTAEFALVHDAVEIGRWLSDLLGIACVFAENTSGGFPDDTDASGPTLISTATLREVASWFPGVSLEEARRRFRANLEIGGVPPFWEDQCVGPTTGESPCRIDIGGIQWLGRKACQRCVVPSRVSETGETAADFQKTFAIQREKSLPSWAPRERFDHFYRLAVNTRLASGQTPGRIAVGAPVRLTVRETLR